MIASVPCLATGTASRGRKDSDGLPEAMRVLTSPAETGAVTLALPQDVQTEAYDTRKNCSSAGLGPSPGRAPIVDC